MASKFNMIDDDDFGDANDYGDDRYLTDPEWDEFFDFAMGRDIDGLADLGCGD